MENLNLLKDLQSSITPFIDKSFDLGVTQMGEAVLSLVEKEMVDNETGAITLEELERCVKKALIILNGIQINANYKNIL